MKIIGEKINGTRKLVGKAIAERDAEFIQNLAKRQIEGGAHWLDVNAGTAPDREAADLIWLVGLVQQVSDAPLCLDSANPDALRAAMQQMQLSARAYHRILKLARTIADLAGSDKIETPHLAEAIQYRPRKQMG